MESSTAAPSSNLSLPGMVLSDSRVNLFGIQGEPTTGKTTAALTFPDPHVMDFDNKLPKGVKSWPFHKDDFIHSLMNTKPPVRPNRKDAILRWLRTVGVNIPASATLILDSYTTGVDNMHNLFVAQNPNLFMSKDNNFDGMKAFKDKLLFNLELFGLLRSLDCQVVVTFHEQAERAPNGAMTGRFRPLASGQFKDQLAANFGMLVRSLVVNKKDFRWQVQTNALFTPMISPQYKIPPEVQLIEPTWDALQKYKV